MAKDIILCGLDGVLANNQHRQLRIAKKRCTACINQSIFSTQKCRVCNDTGLQSVSAEDHAAFEASCSGDQPQATTIEMLKLLRNSMHIQLREPELWILSGRPEAVRKQTAEWLTQNLVPATRLLMRKAGDNRQEAHLKRGWLQDKALITPERIFCVIDHLPECVAMWREEGLTCYQASA